MICLGLEDIDNNYKKNEKLDEACNLLHQYGIMTYLSFIVNPLKVKTEEQSKDFYDRLLNRFYELKPEMVCGNFLMPFRGTIEKDLENRKRIEYEMFYYQLLYYTSDFYRENVRNFDTDDTLRMRFEELQEQFSEYEESRSKPSTKSLVRKRTFNNRTSES